MAIWQARNLDSMGKTPLNEEIVIKSMSRYSRELWGCPHVFVHALT